MFNRHCFSVSRISSMIRGVGYPTVALYARMYLAITSSQLLSRGTKTDVMIDSFNDYLFTYQEFKERKLIAYLQKHEIDHTEFLAVHSPGVQWLLRSIGSSASLDQFNSILSYYKQHSANSMVLKHILDACSRPVLYGSMAGNNTSNESLEPSHSVA